jgi:hypothetical protein
MQQIGSDRKESGHRADIVNRSKMTLTGSGAVHFAVVHNTAASMLGCGPGLRKKLMRRREFITLVGSAAATWPLAAQRGRPIAQPLL